MNEQLKIIKALYFTYQKASDELKPYFEKSWMAAIENYLTLFYINIGASDKLIPHTTDNDVIKLIDLGIRIKRIMEYKATPEETEKLYRNVVIPF